MTISKFDSMALKLYFEWNLGPVDSFITGALDMYGQET